jgi:NADPH2:quinone reductase
MDKAIVINSYGGPEVLEVQPVTVGDPGPNELKLRQSHVGVNFHDIYVRTGAYKTLSLPGVPGIEGVGYVEKIGENVTGFNIADRVIYLNSAYGAYASSRLLPADLAVRLPLSIASDEAVAVYLKGLTVQMLLRRLMPINEGDWVLVHAAAGGVGKLLVQALLRKGVQVIATVGSSEKAKQLHELECCHVILYREEDFVAATNEITDGHGVDVVFDSVGKDTFNGSLEVLAKCGHLVNFGQSSGNIEPLDIARLAAKSATLSRPILFHYLSNRLDLEELSSLLFADLERRWLIPEPPIVYPLSDAAKAHALLESRNSSAPIVLEI